MLCSVAFSPVPHCVSQKTPVSQARLSLLFSSPPHCSSLFRVLLSLALCLPTPGTRRSRRHPRPWLLHRRHPRRTNRSPPPQPRTSRSSRCVNRGPTPLACGCLSEVCACPHPEFSTRNCRRALFDLGYRSHCDSWILGLGFFQTPGGELRWGVLSCLRSNRMVLPACCY